MTPLFIDLGVPPDSQKYDYCHGISTVRRLGVSHAKPSIPCANSHTQSLKFSPFSISIPPTVTGLFVNARLFVLVYQRFPWIHKGYPDRIAHLFLIVAGVS